MRLGSAEVHWTSRRDGDFRIDDPRVDQRRRALFDAPWSQPRQVHGTDVLVVRKPGDAMGSRVDALVSDNPHAVLAVQWADCAPIALSSPEGVVGAVHAGWRGLLDGIVDNTVAAMRALGASEIVAALGPCIYPECYRFSQADLQPLVERFGDEVRGTTSDSATSLDLPATVRLALEGAGVSLEHVEKVCTACSTEHFSYRARHDIERQVMVVRRAPQ